MFYYTVVWQAQNVPAMITHIELDTALSYDGEPDREELFDRCFTVENEPGGTLSHLTVHDVLHSEFIAVFPGHHQSHA